MTLPEQREGGGDKYEQTHLKPSEREDDSTEAVTLCHSLPVIRPACSNKRTMRSDIVLLKVMRMRFFFQLQKINNFIPTVQYSFKNFILRVHRSNWTLICFLLTASEFAEKLS